MTLSLILKYNTDINEVKCHFISYIAVNCSVLTCGTNEICVQLNNIYQCVCHGDYTGEDCSTLGKWLVNVLSRNT